MDDVREALNVLQNSRDTVDKARAEAWLILSAEGAQEHMIELTSDEMRTLVKRMYSYGVHNDRNYPPIIGGDDYIEMACTIANGSILEYFLQFDSIDSEGWVLYKDIRAYASAYDIRFY